MYLWHNSVKRCSHSLISVFFWPKNLSRFVVTKIAFNVILWFLKKVKFNCRFSSLIRKLESGGKSTIIRKMRLPSNDVEICFLNWWSAFMFVWTNGLIEYENIDLSAAYFGGFSTKNSPVFWVFRRFNEIISMNRS